MRYQLGRFDYNLVSKAAVVVITGKDETAVFCRMVADLIRTYNNKMGDLWVCETLAEFEQKARNPAFFGRWWYSGSADRLSAEDKRALDKLVKKPVSFGTAVLTGVDFSKYRSATKGTKASQQVHEITTSFPSSKYLLAHIQREVLLRGAKISQTAAETFMWRLGEFYSKYEYYLDLLISELPKGVQEVKKDHVIKTLKGVQGASFDDFIKYLMRPLSNGDMKRTTKLFQTCSCMIEDSGAAKTLTKLHNKAIQYLELRRLINAGYIPVGVHFTVEALTKLLQVKEEPDEEDDKSAKKRKSSDGKFTYKDILLWSDMKLNREVAVAAQAPLADWYTIVLLSSKRCTSDLEAERILFDIITRSRRTDIMENNEGRV